MTELALVFTDLEGSTALAERLGDSGAAALFAEHDRLGRGLIAARGGREIDHSDGFFAFFPAVAGAAAFALGYQAALAALGLAVRVGIHFGAVALRHNDGADVARGAKPIEVEGLAKPLAARVMAHARGGQTLLTASARDALGGALPAGAALESHGHYRLKGIAQPVELFELGPRDACAFSPPPDSDKAYRVVRASGDALWQPLRQVRHNLVAERDAFIGRATELHALAQQIDAGARLVSVLGAGGSGKTRFVSRYARTWLGDWPGGVVFADLSEARSLDGILAAVAAALDLVLSSAAAARQIGHAISARGRCLVVLDNFEQVVEYAEATLGTWLALTAEASFVVTSRARLHIQGEQILALEPLPLATDAVELFAARARAQRPGFRLDDANQADVERIVSLLDGLPLAIELAAARVRVLAPAQLVERLRDRFALLAGARGAAARQATLRAAIDWSWDLLAPWEQGALAQCAVFEGGFTLDAAEQVLDLGAWPDAPPALDVVQALVDKSLLRSWVPATPGRYSFDEPYFGMYVSVHEYATAKLRVLGDAPLRAAQVRHGRCFAAHGTDTAIEVLYGPDGGPARRALALELDNLLCACRRAVARDDGAIALATYRAAWEVLELRGPFGTAVDLGAQLLTLGTLDAGQRAQVLRVRANAAQRAGRMAQAQEWLETALALAREAGDRRGEALARSNLGNVLRNAGLADEARAEFDAALQLHRTLVDRRALGAALSGLGVLEGDLGDTRAALAHLRQALDIQRALGNRVDETSLIALIAVQLAECGDLADARTHFEESLAISESLGDRVAMGENLTNLATLALEQGRDEPAAENYERALAIHREVGNRRFEGYVQGDIGRMLLDRGRLDDARPHLEQSLAIAQETGERRQQGAALRSLGELALSAGQTAVAQERLDAAETLLRAVGDKLYLAKVLCGLAELALRAGDRASAHDRLAEARGLAAALGAGAQSQLGRAIDALAASLA